MNRFYRTMTGLMFCIFLMSYSQVSAMGVRPGEPVFVEAPSTYELTWRDDIKITAHDGVLLAANIFVPKPSYPGETFPVIIMPASWNFEEHEYYIPASKLCEKGYIVLPYSPRGWGISTGLVAVGGIDDMKDITSIINYLAAYYPVQGVLKNSDGKITDDSKARIGLCGSSYGGGLSILGAAYDKRVKAVMAMVPWGDLCNALYFNQTTKEVWHKIILFELGEIIGNLDPQVKELTDMLFAQDQPKYYDHIVNWALDRSPIAYLDALNYTNDGQLRDIAISISSNLEDEIFPPNVSLDFYYGLKIPKKHLDINRGIHASAEVGGMLGMENTVWNKANAWMDEHLKGVKTGIMDLKPMSICDKGNGQRYYTDHIYLKDLNISYLDGLYNTSDNVNTIRPEMYYLGARPDGKTYGKLSSAALPSAVTNTIETGSGSGITTGMPVVSSFLEAHTNFLHVYTPFIFTSKKKAIVFESEPMTSDHLIMGTPHVKLNVTPTTSSFELIAHLYTVNSLGIGTLISHAPLTILGNGKMMPNAKAGEKLTIEFNFITTCAKVEKGQRLALAIDTEDPNYGPAPDKVYQLKFSYDGNSYLSIPVMP